MADRDGKEMLTIKVKNGYYERLSSCQRKKID